MTEDKHKIIINEIQKRLKIVDDLNHLQSKAARDAHRLDGAISDMEKELTVLRALLRDINYKFTSDYEIQNIIDDCNTEEFLKEFIGHKGD